MPLIEKQTRVSANDDNIVILKIKNENLNDYMYHKESVHVIIRQNLILTIVDFIEGIFMINLLIMPST